MMKFLHFGIRRRIARVLAPLCLLLWHAPPAAAFAAPRWPLKTQTLTPAQRRQVEAREAKAKRRPDVRKLTAREMGQYRGRGQYRNKYYNGVLPWQRSLRDANLCTGNLFKSFTDIQVPPARGAGLAFQRTSNSNSDRIGPFGIGWTHAYEIRNEEAASNTVDRTDFFGGKHNYRRDADGLYSPPPYMFDELSSEYGAFLESGPQAVLSDEQKGMGGTVKHFFANGPERDCDWIEDRHLNRTTLQYNQWSGGADECDRFGPAMVKLIDDEGRDVEYDTTLQGALLQVRSNRSYAAGGALVAQQVAEYTYDQGMQPSLSHGWLKRIRNYWHYQEYSQWVQRTLVQNDYTYSATGNRLTNAISDHTGPLRTEVYGYDEVPEWNLTSAASLGGSAMW